MAEHPLTTPEELKQVTPAALSAAHGLHITKGSYMAEHPLTTPEEPKQVTPAALSAAHGLRTTQGCLIHTSPSPRDRTRTRMPDSS